MLRLRRLGLVALVSLATLVVPAVSAAAPDTVITFDDLPASATENVDDEYLALGVELGHPHRWGIDVGIDLGCGGTGASLGAQYVVNGGITGRSLDVSCTGRGLVDQVEDKGISVGWRYTVERPRVSFNLRADANPTFAGTQAGPFAITVRYLGVAGNVLAQQGYSIAKGATVSPSLNHGVISDIAYVVITAPEGRVLVDDVVAGLDDVPPPPKYTIALLTPTLDLVEGDTGLGQVKAVRFNGSTGTVPLSVVGGLPAGIVAAAAADPLAGTAAVSFVVTAATPASGERQVQLTSASGPAGTFVGSPVLLTIRLRSALFGDRTTLGATPGCGTVNASIAAGVRGNYAGTVTLTLTKLGGPATVIVVTATANAAGNGTITFPLTVTSPPTESPSTYEATLTPAGATPITFGVAVYAGAAEQVRISSLENTFLYRPPNARGRQFQAIVRGNFPASCAIVFRDDLGNTLNRVAGSVSREAGQDEGLRLDLGTDPVSTRIHAVAPGGAELAVSGKLTVADYRNTSAPWQANAGAGAGAPRYNWNDFVRAFGKDDAESCFDAYCWRDSTAVAYYNRWSTSLAAGNGLCFGWSSQSISFFTQTELAKEFDKQATSGYTIGSYSDGSPAKANVGVWQSRYFNRDTVLEVQRQVNRPLTVAELQQRIDDALTRNQPPIIVLWNAPYGSPGVAGHAVVALETRPTAGGGFTIVTYNPNAPYVAGEESNAAVRTANLQTGTITVTAAGVWSGGITGWTGGMNTIEVVALPPLNASLPIDLPAVSASAPGRGVTIAQITVDGKEALDPDGSVIEGRGVAHAGLPTGGSPVQNYLLTGDGPATLELAGTRAGPYGASLLGGSVSATVEGARIAKGQRDTLVVEPNAATVEFASDAASTPVTLGLDLRLGSGGRAPSATDPSNPTRSVRVALRAGGDRSDRLSVGTTVSLVHEGGPTTAAVTLVQTGGGLPQSVTFAPLALAADQTLSLRPDSWADLARGATFTVRTGAGQVVRRGRLTRLAPKTIALGTGVAVATRRLKSGRGVVTVSGRVLKRGSAPQLIAKVTVLSGGKTIATAYGTRRGTARVRNGRFSIPIGVKTLPAGAQVRVSLTLLDEATSLASITRTAAVRAR